MRAERSRNWGVFCRLGEFILVLVPGGNHTPLLLLPGDLDQGLAGGGVAPALVPDRLGEAVQGEDLGEGVSCLADHPGELFVRVTLLFEQAIKSLGLFDGGEVLAEEVLHKGDLGVVALNEGGGDGGQACLFRGLDAASPAATIGLPASSTRKMIGCRIPSVPIFYFSPTPRPSG